MNSLNGILKGGTDIVVADSDVRAPSVGAGPVERIAVARPALPCSSCSHEPVCAIRGAIDLEALALRTPVPPHEALRVTLTVVVECRHHLAAEPVVKAAPVETKPGPKPVRVLRRVKPDGKAEYRNVEGAAPAISAAERLAEGRRRGGQVIHERAEARKAETGERVYKRTPEQRERMRQAQLAIAERRRAAASTGEAG